MGDAAVLKIIVADEGGTAAPQAPPTPAAAAGVTMPAVVGADAAPPGALAQAVALARQAGVPGAAQVGTMLRVIGARTAPAAAAGAGGAGAAVAGAGAAAGAAATGGAAGVVGAGLAAAEPAGVTVAAALAAVKATAMVGDALGGLTHAVGDATAGLITMGGNEVIGKAGASIEGLGDKLEYIAPIISIPQKVAGAAVSEFSVVVGAMSNYAKNLSQYSPVGAQAEVQADMRALMGDFRRAQALGPQLARFIDSRSSFEQSWEDFKTRFISVIEPILTSILNFANGFVKGLDTQVKIMGIAKDAVAGILQVMTGHFPSALESDEQIQERLRNIQRILEGNQDDIQPLTALREGLKSAYEGAIAERAQQDRASGAAPAFAI